MDALKFAKNCILICQSCVFIYQLVLYTLKELCVLFIPKIFPSHGTSGISLSLIHILFVPMGSAQTAHFETHDLRLEIRSRFVDFYRT